MLRAIPHAHNPLPGCCVVHQESLNLGSIGSRSLGLHWSGHSLCQVAFWRLTVGNGVFCRAAINANLDRPDRSDQAEPRHSPSHEQQYNRRTEPHRHISDGPQAAAYPGALLPPWFQTRNIPTSPTNTH